ncbi:MAG TPA: hypothetical protein VND66_04675 [Acidobacteriaceae bacterium]|nr:hypothetical protein [Acidobacteriaceae bacterium]
MKSIIRTINGNKSDSPLGRRAIDHRNFFVAVLPMILAMGLMWWPFGGARKVIMVAASSVPSARGTVYVSHDRNQNVKVDMKVHYLAHPSALTPPESIYVVWIQANGRSPKNEGELRVDSNLNGEFKTPVPYKQFTIFVTAEKSVQVHEPEGQQVLTATVAQR